MSERLREHNHNDARNKVLGSPWCNHYQYQYPNMRMARGSATFRLASVIGVESGRAGRRLREEIEGN